MAAPALDLRGLARIAAQKYGVPPELFLRQLQQESGFNPKAVSPAGARGVAQFMPATARGMGVNLYDNDPRDDILGSARLMAQHLKTFGNYEDAAEAYNAGPGAVVRGPGAKYAETRNYIAAIMGGGARAPQQAAAPPPVAATPRSALEGVLGQRQINAKALLGALYNPQRRAAVLAGKMPPAVDYQRLAGMLTQARSAPQVGVPDLGSADPHAGHDHGPIATGPTQFAADPTGGYGWAQDIAKRYGLQVTSTLRDASKQARIYGGTGKRAQFTSRHLVPGAAADISGSPEQMRRLAEWAGRSGLFAEVFYDPWGQFDNGKYSPKGIGGHDDHVHLSAGAPLFRKR